MTYNKFVTTEPSILMAGEPIPEVPFVCLLLRWLRVYDAERHEQEAAIARWLKGRIPNDTLKQDLRDEGFGHLLGEAHAA